MHVYLSEEEEDDLFCRFSGYLDSNDQSIEHEIVSLPNARGQMPSAIIIWTTGICIVFQERGCSAVANLRCEDGKELEQRMKIDGDTQG